MHTPNPSPAVLRANACHEVAAENVACAIALPGAEDLDPTLCSATLDEWTACVRRETHRLFPVFRRDPGDYENSEAYYRVLVMVTVLHRDLGVRS